MASRVKQQYTETKELPSGALQANGPEDMPTNQRGATVKKYTESHVDENGNIIVTGPDEGPEGFRANATVVQRYEKTEEGPDGNLHATGPAPDFAE